MIVRAMIFAVLMSASAAAAPPETGATSPDWVPSARAAAGELSSRLKAELTSALAESGPRGGVAVCRDRAPAIAASVSTEKLDIGRTALRVRNAENAPDRWERSVLESFRSQMRQGADPSQLERWQVLDSDGRKLGRWMKAIPMGPKCATCHGSDIAEPLADTIRTLYPDDEATGFTPGELRGAFTVRVDLSRSDTESGDG
jgi:hypothetical protein